MNKINVAVVGCGYWGPNLIRNFYNIPSCDLKICCDLDMEQLSIISEHYPNVAITQSYSDILSDDAIDATVIATPARTHFLLAKEALISGKHVFVEKPLAMSSEEAEVLIRLAEQQSRILMVGHVFEYNPAVVKIKEMVNNGELGTIYYIYSTRVNLGRVQTDINAMWSLAPHDISIILFLLGSTPVSVSAKGQSYLNEGNEDIVFLTLDFPNKVMAQVHVSWLDPGKIRKMTIVGSEKMVIFDDVLTEEKVKVFDKGFDIQKPYDNFGEFQFRLRTGDVNIPKIDMSEPLKLECLHFLECIRDKKAPRTDGIDGLKTVRVLEAAQKSLESRGIPVEVKIDV